MPSVEAVSSANWKCTTETTVLFHLKLTLNLARLFANKSIFMYFMLLSSLVLFSKVNYHNSGINTSLVTRLLYTKSMRQKKCDLNHQPMPIDSAVQCMNQLHYSI